MAEPLRPLTIGELLDRSFTIFRRHFLLFVGLSALPGLFTFGAEVLESRLSGTSILADISLLLLSFVTAMLAAMFSIGAATIATSRIQGGQVAGISESFRAFWPMLKPTGATMLMYILLTAGGLLLLIVPGVLLLVRWGLAVPIVVLERRSAVDALKRSSSLSLGYRSRIFWVIVLTLALYTVVLVSVPLPLLWLLGLATDGLGVRGAAIAASIATFLTSTLTDPPLTIAGTLLYYDIRIRKEAFDLEHMMAEIDRDPAAHFVHSVVK